MLDGYKTYIAAFVIAVVAGAQYLGFIDAATATAITGIFIGGGFAALRAAK